MLLTPLGCGQSFGPFAGCAAVVLVDCGPLLLNLAAVWAGGHGVRSSLNVMKPCKSGCSAIIFLA